MSLIDPSTLTLDQLNELINKKKTTEKSIDPDLKMKNMNYTVDNSSKSNQKEIDIIGSSKQTTDSTIGKSSVQNTGTNSDLSESASTKKCSYKPTRANQPECTEQPTVFYGIIGYCTKHKRTVQASNTKKEYEEQKRVEEDVIIRERLEKERLEKEKVEKERLDKERLEKERLEKEKVEKERLDKEKVEKTPVITSDNKNIIRKKILPNKWGRFEDLETHILFDPKTKAAYGVQNLKTGKVMALEDKHISICKRNGWKYHLIREDEEEEQDDEEEEEQDDEEEEEQDDEEEEEQDDNSTEICEECGNTADECTCILNNTSDEDY